MEREYYCHYCDEIVVLDDNEVTQRGDSVEWMCPCCGMYNDTEAVADGD